MRKGFNLKHYFTGSYKLIKKKSIYLLRIGLGGDGIKHLHELFCTLNSFKYFHVSVWASTQLSKQCLMGQV